MIDLHSHVLAGLDDGAATIDESLAIARTASADGVRVLAATPHVRDDFPTTVVAMRRELTRVRDAVAAAGLAIEVVPGGELSLDRLRELPLDDIRGFGLGGNPNAVLVEFPYDAWPTDLAEQLVTLLEAGVRPVLAHPERNPDVQAAPSRLAPLVAEGALVQVTASSLTGEGGRHAKETARRLIDGGLAQLVASDAHGPSGRESRMSSARAALRSQVLGEWLTEGVPGAILRAEDLPARPTARRGRRLPFSR